MRLFFLFLGYLVHVMMRFNVTLKGLGLDVKADIMSSSYEAESLNETRKLGLQLFITGRFANYKLKDLNSK